MELIDNKIYIKEFDKSPLEKTQAFKASVEIVKMRLNTSSEPFLILREQVVPNFGGNNIEAPDYNKPYALKDWIFSRYYKKDVSGMDKIIIGEHEFVSLHDYFTIDGVENSLVEIVCEND